jgi:hypothetical protein
MYHRYETRNALNGSLTTRTIVNCYLTLPPYDAEPEFNPRQIWCQMLPPTKMHESTRNKRIWQTMAKVQKK